LASKGGSKKGGTGQFYPFYVNEKTGMIEGIGDALMHDAPFHRRLKSRDASRFSPFVLMVQK